MLRGRGQPGQQVPDGLRGRQLAAGPTNRRAVTVRLCRVMARVAISPWLLIFPASTILRGGPGSPGHPARPT